MGAALTYARRYALFTLVGIAGEDDVDAPDLLPPEQQTSGSEKPKGNGSLNGGQHHAPARAAAARSTANARLVAVGPALSPEASAQLRDRLLGELNELAGGDEAALWAHRSLPEKNKLIAADALCVEEAFQARLASFATPAADQPRRQEVVRPLTSKVLVRAGPKAGCNRRRSTRASWLYRSPAGYVTAITSDMWPSSRVWFAVVSRRIPTTCALHNAVRSAQGQR